MSMYDDCSTNAEHEKERIKCRIDSKLNKLLNLQNRLLLTKRSLTSLPNKNNKEESCHSGIAHYQCNTHDGNNDNRSVEDASTQAGRGRTPNSKQQGDDCDEIKRNNNVAVAATTESTDGTKVSMFRGEMGSQFMIIDKNDPKIGQEIDDNIIVENCFVAPSSFLTQSCSNNPESMDGQKQHRQVQHPHHYPPTNRHDFPSSNLLEITNHLFQSILKDYDVLKRIAVLSDRRENMSDGSDATTTSNQNSRIVVTGKCLDSDKSDATTSTSNNKSEKPVLQRDEARGRRQTREEELPITLHNTNVKRHSSYLPEETMIEVNDGKSDPTYSSEEQECWFQQTQNHHQQHCLRTRNCSEEEFSPSLTYYTHDENEVEESARYDSSFPPSRDNSHHANEEKEFPMGTPSLLKCRESGEETNIFTKLATSTRNIIDNNVCIINPQHDDDNKRGNTFVTPDMMIAAAPSLQSARREEILFHPVTSRDDSNKLITSTTSFAQPSSHEMLFSLYRPNNVVVPSIFASQSPLPLVPAAAAASTLLTTMLQQGSHHVARTNDIILDAKNDRSTEETVFLDTSNLKSTTRKEYHNQHHLFASRKNLEQEQVGGDATSSSKKEKKKTTNKRPSDSLTNNSSLPVEKKLKIVQKSKDITISSRQRTKPLGIKMDEKYLSKFLCFIRSECIEVFTANENDVCSRKRSKKIQLGQVGIRCRFCAHLPSNQRVTRSSNYPSFCNQLYSGVSMMIYKHFSSCKEMPEEIKTKFHYLRNHTTTREGRATTHYWVESAKAIGMVDSNDEKQWDQIQKKEGRFISKGVRMLW